VDGDTLHTAATVVVVLSLHKAVAVYVAVPPSFTDEGPLTVTPVSTGGPPDAGTSQAYAGASADSSPVLRTVFTVKYTVCPRGMACTSGSKVADVWTVEATIVRREAGDKAASVVQYSVYMTVLPASIGVLSVYVVTGSHDAVWVSASAGPPGRTIAARTIAADAARRIQKPVRALEAVMSCPRPPAS